MYRSCADDEEWDDDFQRQRALRLLVCSLCNVRAEDEDAMTKHLSGGPHIRQLQRYREDWCKRMAEKGKPLDRVKRESTVMPPMEERQKEWNDRYTKGAKGMKREVEDIRSLIPNPAESRFQSSSYDNGQYKRSPEFYCDVCDVYVGSRNIMESHLSGKEHLRRQKPTRQYKCDTCLVYVSSEETLRSHMQGNAHLRKVAQKEEMRLERKRKTCDPTQDELEELYKLREMVSKQQSTIDNLQKKVGELMKERNFCILNHDRNEEKTIKHEGY